MFVRLKFAAPGNDQREAEFREGSPFFPYEIKKRCILLWIRCAWFDAFPAGVGQVERIVK